MPVATNYQERVGWNKIYGVFSVIRLLVGRWNKVATFPTLCKFGRRTYGGASLNAVASWSDLSLLHFLGRRSRFYEESDNTFCASTPYIDLRTATVSKFPIDKQLEKWTTVWIHEQCKKTNGFWSGHWHKPVSSLRVSFVNAFLFRWLRVGLLVNWFSYSINQWSYGQTSGTEQDERARRTDETFWG